MGAVDGAGSVVAGALSPGRGSPTKVGRALVVLAVGAAAVATSVFLRVSSVAPLTRPLLISARMVVLRAAAVEPPNTTPSTCLRPRRTEATKLKPEARV